MSKKKMYGLLSFIAFTFLVLTAVLVVEFGGLFDNNGKEPDIVQSEEDGEGIKEEVREEEIDTEEVGGNIEDDNEEGTKEEPEPDKEPLVMVFTGDIYLSDYVTNAYDRDGVDGILSKDLKEELTGADIAMANQEFTFSTRGVKAPDKQFTFRVNPKYVSAFSDMGLDIVTLANNHSLDFGREALKDSFENLKEQNILYSGAGNNRAEAKETKYIEAKGKTIAILSASRVIPVPEWNATATSAGLFTTYDPTELIEEIKIAREKSDYVVVYVHWGIERDVYPKEYQRTMGKQYIDAGADLVVGSHPHVLQGIEYYNGKPIVYSLGNFMFYSNIEQTAILKLTLDKDNKGILSLLPCRAKDGRTYLVDESEREAFYTYMESISYDVTFSQGIAVESE